MDFGWLFPRGKSHQRFYGSKYVKTFFPCLLLMTEEEILIYSIQFYVFFFTLPR